MSFSQFTEQDYELIRREYGALTEAAAKRCANEREFAVVQKAFDFANEAHKNVRRRSGEPYIIHPLNVAIILADLELDKEMTAAMLRNYAEQVPEKYHPDFYKTIKDKFKGNYEKYVKWLYKKSSLMKTGKLDLKDNKYQSDPGVIVGTDLIASYAMIGLELYPLMEQISAEEKKLCAAKIRMEEDLPHYSDANFTMRLSYGQVCDVLIGGKPAGYYTTAESIVEKMQRADENAEYYAEPVMHELLSANDYGKYQDKTSGKMQLCFISNNDITGGNSGSPVFNGKGELIGLAFDGNWDSLASDIMFDKVLARCINVDIRYVLYLMDKWGHADRLLKEIGAR